MKQLHPVIEELKKKGKPTEGLAGLKSLVTRSAFHHETYDLMRELEKEGYEIAIDPLTVEVSATKDDKRAQIFFFGSDDENDGCFEVQRRVKGKWKNKEYVSLDYIKESLSES